MAIANTQAAIVSELRRFATHPRDGTVQSKERLMIIAFRMFVDFHMALLEQLKVGMSNLVT
jgi:hypothetical protein